MGAKLKLLGEVTSLLSKAGITWWLDFGAALGFARNGELIPWDGDLDISTLSQDREAVREALRSLSKWRLALTKSDPMKIAISRNGGFLLDIYGWEEADAETLRRTGSQFCHAKRGDFTRQHLTLPKRFVAELGTGEIRGVPIYHPTPLREFVEWRYNAGCIEREEKW